MKTFNKQTPNMEHTFLQISCQSSWSKGQWNIRINLKSDCCKIHAILVKLFQSKAQTKMLNCNIREWQRRWESLGRAISSASRRILVFSLRSQRNVHRPYQNSRIRHRWNLQGLRPIHRRPAPHNSQTTWNMHNHMSIILYTILSMETKIFELQKYSISWHNYRTVELHILYKNNTSSKMNKFPPCRQNKQYCHNRKWQSLCLLL